MSLVLLSFCATWDVLESRSHGQLISGQSDQCPLSSFHFLTPLKIHVLFLSSIQKNNNEPSKLLCSLDCFWWAAHLIRHKRRLTNFFSKQKNMAKKNLHYTSASSLLVTQHIFSGYVKRPVCRQQSETRWTSGLEPGATDESETSHCARQIGRAPLTHPCGDDACLGATLPATIVVIDWWIRRQFPYGVNCWLWKKGGEKKGRNCIILVAKAEELYQFSSRLTPYHGVSSSHCCVFLCY